jgi:hypothetical protein
LLKITRSGEVLWNNQFGTINHDGVRGIDFDPLHSYKIVISSLINLPPAEGFIRMYNKDGSLLWGKMFSAAGKTRGTSGKDVSIDSKGIIIHVGLTGADLFGKPRGGSYVYVVKLKQIPGAGL